MKVFYAVLKIEEKYKKIPKFKNFIYISKDNKTKS